MNKNLKRNSILVLTGLAVGAAAGILLAPKSGRETRSDIKRGLTSGYGRGASWWNRWRRRRQHTDEFAADDEEVFAGRR